MDAEKRDTAVAYIEADKDRLELIRILEKKSEPLTLEYIESRFLTMSSGEVYSLLRDLESKDLVKQLTDNPPAWDLSLFGREILYALEAIPRTNTSFFSRAIRNLLSPSSKAPSGNNQQTPE